jgi:iron-sulfur cluster assembly accessory protein
MDVQAPVAITEGAAGKVLSLARMEGRDDAILRIRVTSGGCSGFKTELRFADEPAPDDSVIFAPNGVRLLIDPKSVPILEGSTLDLDTSLMGGGLKVHNPRARNECACGDSFSL